VIRSHAIEQVEGGIELAGKPYAVPRMPVDGRGILRVRRRSREAGEERDRRDRSNGGAHGVVSDP
jgi:hypothetical protein